MKKILRPTEEVYGELQQAYDHFNKSLFASRLPPCLITLQRKNRTYGYFSGDRWKGARGDVRDEIAMNPAHFETRDLAEVLSTLAHEMVHLEQHHFGTPSRAAYHNRQWADWMERIGLMPSDTGAPGGKRTGQQMTHYIIEGGPFEGACMALVAKGFRLSWTDLAGDARPGGKSGSRTKYACPSCSAAVWGKDGLRLGCMDCEAELEAVA
jgi:predicted SprT family Zn-dependent metalloprotease